MGILTLVCSCGMKLKAPGAVPGRVGKCPRCGSMLKVPDDPGPPDPPPTGPEVLPGPAPELARPTFSRPRGGVRKGPAPRWIRSGSLVSKPTVAETRLVDSLTYPLWDMSGVGLLSFLPPLLWIGTVPLFAIVPAMISGTGFSVIGLVLFLPVLIGMLVVVGHILLFLGEVLVTSALGEVHQPRPAAWDLGEIGRGLGRWFWALVVSGTVGGLPALVYWISCGEIDFFDRIVLVDLIVPGLAYAQMALLAALMYDSPLAANPVTVLLAIRKVGWAYIAPCVLTGSALVILSGLFGLVLRIGDPFGQAVALWLFWVTMLYAAMVVLRRLGLFCYRHAVILEWFPGRTRRAR